MKRRAQPSPMRLLIVLAVTWAAGSWLFAAESPRAPASTRAASAAQPTAALAQAADESAGVRTEGESSGVDDSSSVPVQVAAADEENAANVEASDYAAREPAEQPRAEQSQGAKNAGSSPRKFVPSEQVRADFDVSFPIDI